MPRFVQLVSKFVTQYAAKYLFYRLGCGMCLHAGDIYIGWHQVPCGRVQQILYLTVLTYNKYPQLLCFPGTTALICIHIGLQVQTSFHCYVSWTVGYAFLLSLLWLRFHFSLFFVLLCIIWLVLQCVCWILLLVLVRWVGDLTGLGKLYVVKHNCVTWGLFNNNIMDNYMFRPVLAIFRLSYGNLRSYCKILSSPKTTWRWPVQAETCSCPLYSH